ncbi:MAG TPA: ABC transporter ATP-binding protein [Candidatus Dormibacteraeota bacterium]|nr:ABC transporter ATP-binding protein [Candidatus Dormibacteraeota bacterium]
MTTLVARDLTVRFAGLAALTEVTFAVRTGEVVGLIGPNGSGKTTLLNAISGIVAPVSGSISLGTTTWRVIEAHKAARLGIRRTFQNIRLFEDLTVLETVEVPAAALGGSGNRRHRALSALEQVGLASCRDQLAQTLPYDLQRRLEIARMLPGHPLFLLLDEPTAGLNPDESQGLVEIVLALRSSYGCGVVMIAHDVRVIMTACERVVVLNEGHVIAEGDPESVRNDPAVIKAYLG